MQKELNSNKDFIIGHRMTNKELSIMKMIESDNVYKRNEEFFKQFDMLWENKGEIKND